LDGIRGLAFLLVSESLPGVQDEWQEIAASFAQND
jgi:hypothetical protein